MIYDLPVEKMKFLEGSHFGIGGLMLEFNMFGPQCGCSVGHKPLHTSSTKI